MNTKTTRLGRERIVLCAILAMCCSMSSALAAGTGSGQVVYFVPFNLNGQEAFVVRLSTMSNKPACNGANRFVVSSANNPLYKTHLAMVMSAMMSGTHLFIHGTGSCTIYDNNSENLSYICAGGEPC